MSNNSVISPLSLSNEDLKAKGGPEKSTKVSGLISTFSSKPIHSIHQQHSQADHRSTIEREKKNLPSGSTKYLTTSFESSSNSSSSGSNSSSTGTISIAASASPISSPIVSSVESSEKNTMELLDLISNLPVIPITSSKSTPSSTPPIASNSPKPIGSTPGGSSSGSLMVNSSSKQNSSPSSPSPIISKSLPNANIILQHQGGAGGAISSGSNTPPMPTVSSLLKKSTSLNSTPALNSNNLSPTPSLIKNKQQSMLNVSYKRESSDNNLLTGMAGASTVESPRVLNNGSPVTKSPIIFSTHMPLVVKKTSVDRSNWKSTIIQAKEESIKVIFDSIPGKKIIQKFPIDLSAQEIKTRIFEELGPEYSKLIDQYELRVVSLGTVISNETLALRRQLLLQACNISRVFPKLALVPKEEEIDQSAAAAANTSSEMGVSSSPMSIDALDFKGHIQAELEIFKLIGGTFQRTLESAQDEATSFRRDFARFRLESFESIKNNIPQLIYVSSEPLPPIVPARLVLVVILPGSDNGQKITKKIDAAPNQPIREIKQQIFRKFQMIDRIHTRDKTADDFVLKVTGFREYILSTKDLGDLSPEDKAKVNPSANKGEDFALIDYDYIRKCIGKQQQIQLSFTDNSAVKCKIEEEKISFIDRILENFDDYGDDEDDESTSYTSNGTGELVRNNSFENSSPPLSRSTSASSLVDHNNASGSNGGTPPQNNSASGSMFLHTGHNNNQQTSMSMFFPNNNNNQNAFLSQSKYLPINKVNRLFRVKIVGLRNLNINMNEDIKSKILDSKQQASLFIMIEIYYGGELIANPEYSPIIPVNFSNSTSIDSIDFPDWDKDVWTPFKISIRNLPRASRACFTVYLTSFSSTEPVNNEAMDDIIQKYSIPVGWTNSQLIDHRGRLRTGPSAFKLWEDGRANPIGTCVDNLAAKTPFILFVEFESFIKPIVFTQQNNQYLQPENQPQKINRANGSSPNLASTDDDTIISKSKLDPNDAKKLHTLMQSDPLVKLTSEDKKLIYNYGHNYRMKPKALAKYLLSVNWVDPEQISEAYKQIFEWSPLKPVQALELLDAKFPDEVIRSFAINNIDNFSDADFSDFLLQLTQVLKYEPYHNSRLTKILIHRALSSPSRIGHFFFWFLKSEMHTPEIEERYGLLLEGYLRSCGSHRQDLLNQNQVIESLYTVAMAVKTAPSSSERRKVLMEGLSKIKFPEQFQLPLDPRWEAKGLIVEKCKYMDSKKLPLWLVFENAEPNASPLTVIFKAGDDLRQDILTLQVLRIMDKFWKSSGLDLRLQPYKCIATGDGIGMIEVVLNANTIGNINKDAGGTGALFEEKTLVNWLKDCNPNESDFNKAVETFILSCAGYVVATYVMGIGDRHSDNIMITKHGHLFHIDFGHFLGNYKKKYGFKRERAPFIFTPQYMAIVGGKDSENFKRFVDTCCTAYNILRKNSDLFINLFQLMLSTGIPELQCAEDIDYLRKSLAPGLTDSEAAEEFAKNIIVALNTKTVLLNDIFHSLAH